MNISLNTQQTYISQMNSQSAIFSAKQTVFTSKTQTSTNDDFQISEKGRAMSMAMRQIKFENSDEMKANMNAMQSAYQELDIANLDVSTMSDDEIQEV